MTDFNLAEAEWIVKHHDSQTWGGLVVSRQDLIDALGSAIAHIRKLEALVNQIWEGHRALRERIGDDMTHPLSEELRKLADYETIFTKRENAYTAALRRAADALDDAQKTIDDAVKAINIVKEQGHVTIKPSNEEWDAMVAAEAERDELRRQLEALTDGPKRGYEMYREMREKRDRAEAQAARFREALEWYANPKRPWDHTIAEKALREHDK